MKTIKEVTKGQTFKFEGKEKIHVLIAYYNTTKTFAFKEVNAQNLQFVRNAELRVQIVR